MPPRLLVALPLAGLIPTLLRPDWMPLEWGVAATLPLVAALALWAEYGLRRAETFPFLPVCASFYAICFGLTAFLASFHKTGTDGRLMVYLYTFDSPATMLDGRALWLAGGGSALAALFMLLGRDLLFRQVPRLRLPANKTAWPIQVLAWLLILAHLAYIALPSLSAIPSIGQFLQPGGYIGFGVLFALMLDQRLPRWQAIALLAGAVPLIMAVRLAIGNLTPVIYFFLVAFLLSMRAFGRLPWKSLTVGTVLVIAIYPAISVYRNMTWGDTMRMEVTSRKSPLVFAVTMAQEYGRLVASGLPQLGERLVSVFVTRAGQLPVLSQTVRVVPEKYPYLGGETYRPLLTAGIPRALYPSKPEERFGTEFAHRYGFTWPVDVSTLNLPWLTELQINFGTWGVMLGMALIGLFLAFLDRLFNTADMRPEEAAIGAGIVFPLAFAESNFSLMVGSVPLVTASILVYFHFGMRFLCALETNPKKSS